MMHKYQNIPGWMNYHEAYDRVVEHIPEDGKILEIGCFMGKSTSYLLTNLWNAEKQNVTVYALDTFKGSSEHSFLNNTLGTGGSFKHITRNNLMFFVNRDICQLVEGRSDDPAMIDNYSDEFFDVIMVDGAHEYDAVCEDIDNWWPKLKKGGVMLLDDCYMNSVKQAASERLQDKVPDYMIMTGIESTGIAYKGMDGEDADAQTVKRRQWVKIIPEDHFKA